MAKQFRHGSQDVQGGKLAGATDRTDYFYFFCPKCEGRKIMRLLDYRICEESEKNSYDDLPEIKSKSAKGFTLQFRLHCENCNYSDTVKISNTGWQGGDHSAALG
ncbi:hypothetical protein [Methylomonas sp. Kb3]|uniref:hypothetical protein n=1 Tax=Methylomonas sp. Kb3 TaxID=1611544 RepID=UPI001055F258|nr:hypothetical protein [Methylomonas sp. Kb3]